MMRRGTPGSRWRWFWQRQRRPRSTAPTALRRRSEEHTSELQSPYDLVCRLLLEKKKIPVRIQSSRTRNTLGLATNFVAEPELTECFLSTIKSSILLAHMKKLHAKVNNTVIARSC